MQPEPVVLQEQERFKTLVREPVFHALGEPRNLLRMHVQPLWDGDYRVNGFVGTDAANAKRPYSYFVVANDGKVRSSSPTIHNFYYPIQEK